MSAYYEDESVTIHNADATSLPVDSESVDCVVTSPPYNVGMAYVGVDDSIPWDEYEALAQRTCREMHRVLKPGGRVWLNVAAQTNHPEQGALGRRQDLSRIWQVAMEDAGLWWRDTVVWDKRTGNNATAWGSKLSPNAPNLRGRYEPVLLHFKGDWNRGRIEQNDMTMPEFLEYTRNVWVFGTTGPSTNGGHPAPFPRALPRRAILLSTWPGDTVLDPFMGSGTTLKVAKELGRKSIGIELSSAYCRVATDRLAQEVLAL